MTKNKDKHKNKKNPKNKESSNEKNELEQSLDEKIYNLEDALLRSRAELENALKRSVIEVEKAHKYGVEKLLLELLPVMDSLEHAIDNLSSEVSENHVEGIKLTLKSFETALDKFGISPIYPSNGTFDPEEHEAVSVISDNKGSDNDIVDVLQKGWRLHERVIRPARVIVVKN